MKSGSDCGHGEVDIDALLAKHPGLQAALDVPFDPAWDLRDVQRAILDHYRLMAGDAASAPGACALLRRHAPTMAQFWPDKPTDPLCVVASVAWSRIRQDAKAADRPAPSQAGQQHHAAPLDHLPLLLREFVHTTAAYTQVPPEMTLFAALAAVSFTTAGRLLVDVHGHPEPLGLFLMQRALPSERKSGALTVAGTDPIKVAVARYWEHRQQEQERIADQIDIVTARIKALKAALARPNRDDNDDQTELDEARERLAQLEDEVIPYPVWDVSDATAEGLETLMAGTRGVAASFADEAALLQTINGKYSKDGKANLGSLNSAWSRRSIFVQRASTTRIVPEPHLVLYQLIQPEPFASLMSKLGTGADGFLSRWLYSEPAPHGQRTPRGGDLEHGTVQRWRKTLHALLERCWGQRGTESLTLTDEAWARYDEIFRTIDTERLAERATNGSYAEWLGKAPNGHILRVAALFELIEDPNATEISAATVTRAIQLYGWLRLEARAALGIASGEQMLPEVERDALTWVARQRTRGSLTHLTARDLMRGPKRFREMRREEVEAVLTQLEHADWLTQCEPPPNSAGQSRTDSLTWWSIRSDFDKVWKP